jgi:hypothetical protein
VHAEVWSISGQRVLDAHWAESESTALDVSGLAPGLYVVRSDNQRAPLIVQ